METIDKNKQVVIRFNKEVLEKANRAAFDEIMDKEFINRTASSASNGPDGMWHTVTQILHPAFPDLKIEIYDQIAEGDKVTTRKAIFGTHLGELMGIPPTGKKIKVDVIDIVRLRNGKYYEHWGINTLQNVVSELKGNR